MLSKLLSGIIGGFFVGLFGYMVLSFPLDEPSTIIFLILWLGSIYYAYTAESTAIVWRHLLLTSSVLCFLMPISSFIWTTKEVAGTEGAAEQAGAAIGGSLFVMVTGFLGFFLGIIFLIIGLLVGRKKNSSSKAD